MKWVWGCFAICSSGLRDGLSKKVTVKSRPIECEGVSHVDIGSNSNPGRGNGKCKSPEVGCLICSRNSEKEGER